MISQAKRDAMGAEIQGMRRMRVGVIKNVRNEIYRGKDKIAT